MLSAVIMNEKERSEVKKKMWDEPFTFLRELEVCPDFGVAEVLCKEQMGVISTFDGYLGIDK